MYRFLLAAALAAPGFAADLYELNGQLLPPGQAAITLFGSTFPFKASTECGEDGRFHFRNLRPGTYTVSVFMPDKGEARQTAEVGPGTADSRRRVALSLFLRKSDFTFRDVNTRRHQVSAKELAMPSKAMSEYDAALKDLSRHDVDAAVRHLLESVRLAPLFSQAWNNLGTIAYQTGKYPRAEECFRHSLDADPSAYEPLVNLGGALLTEHKFDEALLYNQRSVIARSNDALANSQLGMTYFEQGKLDTAERYLKIACRLDPAHFSHPQLVLAQIYIRRGERESAAAILEDFLQHHPDYPAAGIRTDIARLRQ